MNKYKRIAFCILLGIALQFCVPLKRQIIIQDKSKKTLRQLQTTDTVLYMPAFEYKLKPKDILGVRFTNLLKGENDLSTLSQQGNTIIDANQAGAGFIIDSLGYIQFPILGRIKISDMNISDAEKEIQKKVNTYLDNVNVNIKMLNFYVIMMGEIASQGKIMAEGDKLTLLEAIAYSGGFKEFANRNKIKIIRRENLKVHIFYVDITDEDLLTVSNIYLMPNDIIIVDPLRVKNLKAYSIANITLGISGISLFIALFFGFKNLLSR
jgi:polysaccharide export outer membrane protein